MADMDYTLGESASESACSALVPVVATGEAIAPHRSIGYCHSRCLALAADDADSVLESFGKQQPTTGDYPLSVSDFDSARGEATVQ